MDMPQPNQSKTIKLTTTQGCLMLLGIAVVFGGIFFFLNARTSRSYSGTVTLGGETYAPYGCYSDGLKLVVNLRPEPAPEGFHEENRAVLFAHDFMERNTNNAIPTKVVAVQWRDQQKNVTDATCTILNDDMTTWRKRQGGIKYVRDDYWSGTVQATCDVPGLGELKTDLKVENCGT